MLDNAAQQGWPPSSRSKAVGEPPLMLATAVWTALKDAIARDERSQDRSAVGCTGHARARFGGKSLHSGNDFLSATKWGERKGPVAQQREGEVVPDRDAMCVGTSTHLTLPSRRDGPLPLPPLAGGEVA